MKKVKKYLSIAMAVIIIFSAIPMVTYADPVQPLVTSVNYVVDDTLFTINGTEGAIVHGVTTVSAFMQNMTFSENTTYKILSTIEYTKWEQTISNSEGALTLMTSWDDASFTAKSEGDAVEDTDKLVVKMTDDTLYTVYTVLAEQPEAPQDEIQRMDAPVISYIAYTNVTGDKITLDFASVLKAPQTYDKTKFAVSVNGDPISIEMITINPINTKLDIILDTPIGDATDVVTISYSDGTLLFADDSPVDAFSDLSVANSLPEVASEVYGAWSIYSHTGNWGEQDFPGEDNDPRGSDYNKHIIIENQGQRITFYGYGQPAYKDFMIMDNSEDTTKVFDFQLDMAGVDYHSMEGGGFLFNTTVTDGKLYGYAILILQSGPTLYKIDGVDIDDFHNTTSNTMTSFDEITLVDSYSLNEIEGSSEHQIRVEASGTSVEMWDNGAKIINGVTLDTPFGHGFGLIASYASHGCDMLSYFTYTNLTIRGVNVIWPIMDLTAVSNEAGDKADLTFTAPTAATAVIVQQSIDGTNFSTATLEEPLSSASTTATVMGLAPNVKYYFRLFVTGGTYAGPSNLADITLPPAPLSSLSATVDNQSITLTFPALTGATAVVAMISTDGENFVEATLETPITSESTQAKILNLTNGTGYTIKLIVTGGGYAGTSNAIEATPAKPAVIIRDEPDPKPTTQPISEKVIVVINGVEQSAGTETKTTEGTQSVVTVQVDRASIEKRIEEAIKENTNGQTNVFQIPVSDVKSNIAKVELTGDTIKNLETNTFNVSVKRDAIEYIIPANEFTIDSVARQMGVESNALSDIKIEIKITNLDSNVTDKYNSIVASNAAELVFPPVSFEIVATTTRSNGETNEVTINKFNNYVERLLEIPSNIDPKKITTGIVFNVDGTYNHVPTDVFQVNGKWYAKLNSLTNSDYSVIWNPVMLESVAAHWSEEAVNDMASRLVIFNIENFNPDQGITRGDFAEYVVRALGLYRVGAQMSPSYSDVSVANARLTGIEIAVEYGLMTGYLDGKFRSNDVISREEAIAVYSKAMAITNLTVESLERYKAFTDFEKTAKWATDFATEVLAAQIMTGRFDDLLDPKANLTYAEAAASIRNLLIKSTLINH